MVRSFAGLGGLIKEGVSVEIELRFKVARPADHGHRAAARPGSHEFMRAFLEQFHEEWNGVGPGEC
jgi:hypothetical protein